MKRSTLLWRALFGVLAFCLVASLTMSLMSGRNHRLLLRPAIGQRTVAEMMRMASDSALDSQQQQERLEYVHKPLARTPEQLLRDVGIVAGAKKKKQQQQQKNAPNPTTTTITQRIDTDNVILSVPPSFEGDNVACQQTVESSDYTTDDWGRTCSRADVLRNTGCCNTSTLRVAYLSCHGCVWRATYVPPDSNNADKHGVPVRQRCCQRYELCVSCCMRHALGTAFRDASEAQLKQTYTPCRMWCRTNGVSLFDAEHEHFEHDYVQGERRFCFLDYGDQAHPSVYHSAVDHHMTMTRVLRRHLHSYRWVNALHESASGNASTTTTKTKTTAQQEPLDLRRL